MKKNQMGPLGLFFLIVIAASVIAEGMIIAGQISWYFILMWIPAVAALAANILRTVRSGEAFSLKRFLNAGGFRFCKFRFILLGCLLPLLYLLIPYMIYWRIYPENFAYSGVSILVILRDITVPTILGIFLSLLSAAGEEIGWRGFMVPALYRRWGLNKTLIVSSLFWCCWHLPLLIFGDYMQGTPLWYQVPAFVLCIFPVGVMTGILALKTGSLWPAAFLHAAHNNYDQAIFGLLTRGDNRMYFVSETGILTILCAWILAAALYLAERNRIGEM